MALRAGTLFIVATPIGNLEDVTARALRVLGEVALIAAEDTRRTAHLLIRYAIATRMTSLHEHNEAKKTPAIVERLRGGESIALVSDAGTPTVSDPGARLIRAAIEAHIRVESIPGPSAPIAALAVSGFEDSTFAFLGFPPTRLKDRKVWFQRLSRIGGVVIFFEAPHRVQATLIQLRDLVGDCRVLVAREMTKVHEELVRGPISEVIDALPAPKGEFTVVVEIGHTTETAISNVPGDLELLHVFGEMTNNGGMSRRASISSLSRRYGATVNEIYQAIERAKKSVV
jgi:16S rRNA (cytidine1402-2'-O)-methyltransferase